MWRIISIAALALIALGLFAAEPTSAQAGIVWDAAYFNNPNMFDVPVLRRQDASINFNWGESAPAPGVNPDDFSVRWGADVYLPAGTYRFTARADDAIRVWVNYGRSPLINTWEQPARVNETVTADIYLHDGTHHIQVDYREFKGVANAFMNFGRVDGPQLPILPTLTPPPVLDPVTGGQWTAQYFANTNLGGSPSLIQTESSPTNDWGGSSPTPSIPADNWSGRWTTIQYLPAGNYQLRVRADDGIRVFVDGLAVINEWHNASGQTYVANLNLTAGQHSFLVEFYEAGGVAFLDYTLSAVAPAPAPVPTAVPPVVVSPTGLTATVTAGRLNVRDQPDPFNGRIIRVIDRNDTYPVVGSNTGNTWVQLNVNGQLGWVNAGYVRLNATAQQPPAPTQQVTGATGYFVMPTESAVNIRSNPSLNSQIVGRLPRNQSGSVLGRNFDSSWWLINYNGIVGWVSAPFAPLQSGADINRIPISL